LGVNVTATTIFPCAPNCRSVNTQIRPQPAVEACAVFAHPNLQQRLYLPFRPPCSALVPFQHKPGGGPYWNTGGMRRCPPGVYRVPEMHPGTVPVAPMQETSQSLVLLSWSVPSVQAHARAARSKQACDGAAYTSACTTIHILQRFARPHAPIHVCCNYTMCTQARDGRHPYYHPNTQLHKPRMRCQLLHNMWIDRD
jgi:hypothetical protein